MLLTWNLRKSVATDSQHSLLYHTTVKGASCWKEVHTPVLDDMGLVLGKPTILYYIDGDPRQFGSEKELMEALGECSTCQLPHG